MSEKKWAGLPEAQQKALIQAGNAIWDRTNQYADDHEKELAAREKLVSQGVTWLEDFPAEDRQAYVDAVKVTWKDLADEAGGKAPEYRDRLLKVLE